MAWNFDGHPSYEEVREMFGIPVERNDMLGMMPDWEKFDPKTGTITLDFDCKCKPDVEVTRMPAGFKVPKPGVINEDHYKCLKEQLMPRRIWTNVHDGKRYTTVEWDDLEKTTVSCDAYAGEVSEFNGFTAALAKRIFGSTTNVMSAIEEADRRRDAPAKRKAEIRARNKARKQARHELRIREREKQIQWEMEHERIRREAMKRLDAEDQVKEEVP